MYLAEGELVKARSHFEASLKTGTLWFVPYEVSQVMLTQMDAKTDIEDRLPGRSIDTTH
jgi:hypothetical protein